MINRITYYIPDIENTFQLINIDLEKDWKLLKNGQRWTIQTYLHLKNKNLPVYLSKSLPKEGVVVYQNRHKRYLLKDVNRIKSKGLIFVGIRGDKSQQPLNGRKIFSVSLND